MSIYTDMLATGCKMDNHESDLYVEVTPQTTAIVEKYRIRGNVTTFTSNIEKTPWYEIPFAFDPFWKARMPKNR